MTHKLMKAIRALLDECNHQGVDNMGYVHYIERVRVDEVEYEFEKQCRKDRYYQYTTPRRKETTYERDQREATEQL